MLAQFEIALLGFLHTEAHPKLEELKLNKGIRIKIIYSNNISKSIWKHETENN